MQYFLYTNTVYEAMYPKDRKTRFIIQVEDSEFEKMKKGASQFEGVVVWATPQARKESRGEGYRCNKWCNPYAEPVFWNRSMFWIDETDFKKIQKANEGK